VIAFTFNFTKPEERMRTGFVVFAMGSKLWKAAQSRTWRWYRPICGHKLEK
jgi:hypothetical protein